VLICLVNEIERSISVALFVFASRFIETRQLATRINANKPLVAAAGEFGRIDKLAFRSGQSLKSVEADLKGFVFDDGGVHLIAHLARFSGSIG